MSPDMKRDSRINEQTIPRKRNNQQTARSGEAFVVAELNRRGAYAVPFAGNMPGIDILATNINRSRVVKIQVKTKTKGDWQTSTDEGRPSHEKTKEDTFWILVDIGPDPEQPPKYYICPEWWIRNDIHQNHHEYLRKNPNYRSKLHTITESRVARWQNRWDVLGLF